jgi:class 3 adenylate cyclase
MIACPGCGFKAPDDFAFCPKCATALAAPAAIPEERKTVTTLFCDLVAFTAMSESADPEDVDALLGEYFARATKAIESHGGTVEKFIGDAVVGVFGVPTVHEDDPERAVRAGLRLIEALEGMKRHDGSPLQARIGINTGEALVRLDVDPASGRGFLTGDAVNVAARLQAAAPPGGVVIGDATFRLAGRSFACEPLAPVAAKGKSAPVVAWIATAARSRVGPIADRDGLTPLVDREVELAFLRALFDKAVAAASPQLALIVGEPGIGKSRLVAELLRNTDARPELVTWRQGRCLPYGEGVTFWALSEIVKAHAGILETDDREAVEAKLGAVLPEGEDRAWFRQRLRALLGLEAAKAEREENFTAWLRFLEEMAARGPTVLVLEDLHWADDALLGFLEYFASHVAEVPLLLVATARPELFETHPSFAAVGRVNRVVLEPLTVQETETLVASLIEELAKDVRATIARHAEGNPFYAEESARLVRDTVAGGLSGGESAVAATVQAVIAARLDALVPELKANLSDASVVGDVFWDGALAALGQRSAKEVEAALRELVAKQLIHRVRTSSMAGEREFAFAHALARDVAYGELPRAVRAKKHAAVAAWTESKAGDRADDFAELLAHHYATALDLARAAGEVDFAEGLVEPAVHCLALAGERALALDVAAAERHFARALELAGAGSARRPELLVRWADTLKQRSQYREAADALEESIEAFEAAGDERWAAVAIVRLEEVWSWLSEPDTRRDEAVALLEGDGPSPEKAEVLTEWGYGLWVMDADPAAAIEFLDQAIAISEQLGLPEPVRALGLRGGARCDVGDLRALEDFRRAFAAAEAQGLGGEWNLLSRHHAWAISLFEGPQASLQLVQEGLEVAHRRGAEEDVLSSRAGLVDALAAMGEWDGALAEAAALVPELETAEDVWDLLRLRSQQSSLLARRGEAGEARPLLGWLAEEGRRSDSVYIKAQSLLAAAAVHFGLGDTQAARDLLVEVAAMPGSASAIYDFWTAPDALRMALAADESELAVRLGESILSPLPAWKHVRATVSALLAEVRSEHDAAATGFADAASRWHGFGVPYEEAQALLGQGRCLVALGGAPEAAAPLAAAREIFARLGAKPASAEADELMQLIASA